MKISVVIPAHNLEGLIGKTISSVLNQSLQPDEIIVVDDSSLDATAEHAKSLDHRVRALRVSFGNAAATRNAGVRLAQNDWIAFLDGDDQWLKDHLSSAITSIQKLKTIAHLSNFDILEHSTGNKRKTQPLNVSPTKALNKDDTLTAIQQAGHGFPTSGMVINKYAFLNGDGFNESQKRRHDIEMFIRIIANDYWCYTAEPTWVYREGRPGNISGQKAECDYYKYRALKLNQDKYDGLLDQAIKHEATKSLGSCHNISDPILRNQAWNETIRDVSGIRRTAYRFPFIMPILRKIRR